MRLRSPIVVLAALPLALTFSAPSAQADQSLRLSAPTATAPAASPATTGQAADVRRYLKALHVRFDRGWSKGIVANAQEWLPKDHPANDLTRVVELSIALGLDGQPLKMSVARSCGFSRLDNSALRVIRHAAPLPPLPPSLRESRVTLRWRFHRDARLADVKYATLSTAPVPAPEAMRNALGRDDIARARAILRRPALKQAVFVVVADAAFKAGEPRLRQLALPIASTHRLQQTLADPRQRSSWRAARGALIARKDVAAITRTANALAAAGPKRHDDAVALLAALATIDGASGAGLAPILLRTEPRLVAAAARVVSSRSALEAALAKHADKPALRGPIAVRVRELGPDAKADEIITVALGGSSPGPTLHALSRAPQAKFFDGVAAIVRNVHRPAAVRVAAITAAAAMKKSATPLYIALRAPEPTVRAAAARALGRFPGNRLGTSFRLGGLAKKRDPVGDAALVALARVGHRRFAADVARLARSRATAVQAAVAAELWRFGPPAVSGLATLGKSAEPAVRAAVAASLARIDDPAARKANEALGPKKGPAPTIGVAARAKPSSDLERLVLEAVRLAEQRRTGRANRS